MKPWLTDFILLIFGNAAHYGICLLVIYLFSLGNVYSGSLTSSKIVFLLPLSCKRLHKFGKQPLYILQISPLLL